MPTLRKFLPPPLALAIATLALLGSGCVFQQKASSRIRSFEPYTNHNIGLTDVRTFLSSRTAVLMSGDSRPFSKETGTTPRRLKEQVGCAAAIDPRGYFLTAAHCIGDKPVYLIFVEPGKLVWGQRARVVWRANLKKNEPDLAILHIAGKLNNVFEWSEDLRENDPVLSVGLSLSGKKRDFQGHQHMGGKVLGYEERKGKENTPLLLHDIPLQSGDSGGPLVNAEARLVGINVQGRPPILRFLLPGARYPLSKAECADRKRMAEIIEKDAATPRPAAVQEIFIPGFATMRLITEQQESPPQPKVPRSPETEVTEEKADRI